MAIRFKVTKAQYEKLTPELQSEYIAGEGDGEYVLDVTDLPTPEDVGPVKRALEAERTAHKATKTALSEAKATIDATPDIETLKAEHAKETGKLKTFAEKTLVDNAALALATKISTSPALLLPHIRLRLIADMTGDEPVTKVIGADGKPTDLTIDKLGEEFVANKDFATIIKASNGSGGGTPPKPTVKPLGSGTLSKAGEQGDAPADLSKLAPKDLAARIAERKAANADASAQQQ
jgi:hypothetical protein